MLAKNTAANEYAVVELFSKLQADSLVFNKDCDTNWTVMPL